MPENIFRKEINLRFITSHSMFGGNWFSYSEDHLLFSGPFLERFDGKEGDHRGSLAGSETEAHAVLNTQYFTELHTLLNYTINTTLVTLSTTDKHRYFISTQTLNTKHKTH